MIAGLLPVLLLRKLWLGHGILYSAHSDLLAQFLSIKSAGWRALWEDGMLPSWDPAINAGSPALANPQSGFFNPLEWVYFVFPLDYAANTHVLLTVATAGLTMLLLARQILGPSSASLICAVGYACSFRFWGTIYTGWIPNLSVFAFVPLLPWSIARLASAPSGHRCVVPALVTGLLLSQGDLQQVYYAMLGAVIYATVLMFRAPDRTRLGWWLLVAGILGLFLAAPALLPRWEYATLSTRVQADLDFFLRSAPTLSELSRILDPELVHGTRTEFWENNFYFGLWLLPLWAAALYRFPRQTISLGIGALMAIVLCFDTPLVRLAYQWVPGFWLFRQTPRILFGVQLLVTLVGGLGLLALTHGEVTGRTRLLAVVSGILTAIGAAALYPSALDEAVALHAALALVSLGTLSPRVPPWLLTALWCCLPVMDLELRMQPIIETRPLDKAAPAGPVQAMLERGPNKGRVLIIGRSTMPYGMAGLYGIDTINGYSGIMVAHFVEYAHVMKYGRPPIEPQPPIVWNDYLTLASPELLRALDVHYIVTKERLPLEKIGFELILSFPKTDTYVFYRGVEPRPVYVWRTGKALGPAYFASQLRPAPADKQQLLALLAASPSARIAYVEGQREPVFERAPHQGRVAETHRGTNRYAYTVETAHSAYLILSQVYYPGWKATLNGSPVALHRTNHTLMGCFIPQGKHRLILEQRATLFVPGLLLAVAAALGLALLWRRTGAPTPHSEKEGR